MRMKNLLFNRRGIGGQPFVLWGIFGLLFVFVCLIAFAGFEQGWFKGKFDTGASGAQASNQAAAALPPNVNSQCSQNPAYTGSAVDAFSSSTTVSGTDYVRTRDQNGNNVMATSFSGIVAGAAIQYEKLNNTYFCAPQGISSPINAACGSNQLQLKCYANGTTTQSVYDTDNRVTLSNSATAGTQNVTIGGNETHNLELDFQGASKKSMFPFGGCMAIEFPNTMLPPTVTGAIDGTQDCASNGLHWTYSTQSNNIVKYYYIPAGWDTDLVSGAAPKKAVNIQFMSGAANPSGVVYITERSANYYVTNNGTFALDLEMNANGQSSTQTMLGQAQTVFAVN
jgi:hypothetical protein